MSETTLMEAGREMDALIAERVFGRQTGRWGSFSLMDGGDDAVAVETPRYSTDIAAAWEIVPRLEARYGRFDITQIWGLDARGDWQCTLGKQGWESVGAIYVTGFASTAPLAICRAALQATDMEASHVG
jgi:hypothetical protein